MKVLYNLTNASRIGMLCGLDLCKVDDVQQSCLHGCDDAACYTSLLINQPVSVPGVYLVAQSAQPCFVCSWLENELSGTNSTDDTK